KIGERPGPDTARLLVLARARVAVHRPHRGRRNKCNVAIETRAVVKARMHCRVRVERVSQHGLHPLVSWHLGSQPGCRCSPGDLKLGRPGRTAPSYGGRPAYLIGLSALYLGLGRQVLGRHAVVAMTRKPDAVSAAPRKASGQRNPSWLFALSGDVGGQYELKYRAAFGAGRCPQSPTVPLDDRSADR